MKFFVAVTYAVLVTFIHTLQTDAQLPPQRLQIPGAVLVSQPKPLAYRQHRLLPQQDSSPVPKRRPIPNAVPAQFREPIRPVVEEPEEDEPPTASQILDDEVAKLGLSVLQSAVRTAASPEETQEQEIHRPVPFRPERPVPVQRQDIREQPQPHPQQFHRQRQEVRPQPTFRPTPVTRHEEAPTYRQPQPLQSRAQFAQQQQIPQQVRQVQRVQQQPARQQYAEDPREHQRTRKPPVQILRKYRTDNPDGSITWGYENEDGSFKEETLGIDCVTRGKYGYVDPDGVKREYSYETGNKCDQPEEEEDLPHQALPPQNRPGGGGQKKPQYRPVPPQQAQY